jgi:ribosomal protein L34E
VFASIPVDVLSISEKRDAKKREVHDTPATISAKAGRRDDLEPSILGSRMVRHWFLRWAIASAGGLAVGIPWVLYSEGAAESLQSDWPGMVGILRKSVEAISLLIPPMSMALGIHAVLSRPTKHDGLLRCANCGYILHGLSERRCPECGTPIDPLRNVTPYLVDSYDIFTKSLKDRR